MRNPQLGKAQPLGLTKVVGVPLPWILYLLVLRDFVLRGKPSDFFSSSITS